MKYVVLLSMFYSRHLKFLSKLYCSISLYFLSSYSYCLSAILIMVMLSHFTVFSIFVFILLIGYTNNGNVITFHRIFCLHIHIT